MSISRIINLEQFADGFTKAAIAELSGRKDTYGNPFSRAKLHEIHCMIITKYISNFLATVLAERPVQTTSKTEESKYVIKNVGAVKGQIQDAVAVGFQESMSQFSGHPMEYYCQVKLVPTIPTGSRPC